MKTIEYLSKKYNTDKKMNDLTKSSNGLFGHDYAVLYDKYLQNKSIKNMLEIGVFFGESIKMWNDYFDGSCNIHAIDIQDKSFNVKELVDMGINLSIGNQGSETFLNKVFNDINFDFIVDDGSHRMKDQQISFNTLFSKLNDGGLYVIEDLHTSKLPYFFDSDNEITTIDLLNQFISGDITGTNYISKNDCEEIFNKINKIEIFENNIKGTDKTYIIGFIEKI